MYNKFVFIKIKFLVNKKIFFILNIILNIFNLNIENVIE